MTLDHPSRTAEERLVPLDQSMLSEGLADVRWRLHREVLSGARWIVVDLTRVTRLASPALASFLWAHRVCRARGGGVELRGADRRVRAVLHRTGLDHVLQVRAAPGRWAA
ncbi:STAS domain-containing protein [Klenkia sp. PcliD-1-E]|uniref:STAS domain-containing protein n=1 Tax=Klenkia sp. PcliD-1-E TaxID=2954492 RepID=UPI0020981CFD|nr:STAS domain-containing protein [Klenkia sp. PcliD-1-E]MCO7222518.1 STAS domain-containing protein [Klenkia sp. PcliD-1-E]